MLKRETDEYFSQIDNWQLDKSAKNINKDFKFNDFKAALRFVNQVGELAESEGHHPDILVYSWNKVRLTLTTHASGGLSENDFILAAKIDKLN